MCMMVGMKCCFVVKYINNGEFLVCFKMCGVYMGRGEIIIWK